MRINSKNKASVNALLEIARHTGQGYTVPVPVIAQNLGLSRSYLELILADLVASGLAKSHRGPGGGYSLGKAADEISIYEILKVGAQTLPDNSSLSAKLWADLDEHIRRHLSQITLESFLRSNAAQSANPKVANGARALTSKSRNSKTVIQKKLDKTLVQKSKPKLGPSSVFNFGIYLQES
jgi:Rrf2 family iron-sulfur cluster assembly transcriptional regulator